MKEGVITGQSASEVDDMELLLAASRDQYKEGDYTNELWEKG